jgi:hydroxymethylpyrimidine pyrophosphatase-like HAD family hydrolase
VSPAGEGVRALATDYDGTLATSGHVADHTVAALDRGLTAALGELHLSPGDAVGIGDAENDHAFLAACGTSVAVANALPGLKQRVDLVTSGEAGTGVVELVDRLLADDLPRPRWPQARRGRSSLR